ncbi:MAG: hypothetical protein ABI543_09580, partial [Ignavibacteria bacterium]
YNLPVDKIKTVYENNPDVKYRVLDDKLMTFLIENAKITDVERKDEADETLNDEGDVEKEKSDKESKSKKPKKKKS